MSNAEESPPPRSAEALLEEGDKLFGTGRYAEAGEVYQTAAERSHDDEIWVQAQSMAARSYLIRGLAEQGRPYIKAAATRAAPDAPAGWSRFLGVRGRFEWQDEQDLPKATETFVAMYRFCREHGLHGRAVDAAHMVAITGTDEEKFEWTRIGIRDAEETGQTGWLGPLWNNLGWMHHGRGEYDEALAALLEARRWHHETSGPTSRLAADIFVGIAYRSAGQIEQARETIHAAHATAERLYADEPNDEGLAERLGNAHEQLGELAAMDGANDEAVTHFRRARELYVQAGAEQWGPEEIARVERRAREIEAAE
ncbi:MAG: tetratricopeptide repeat protein [Planctomycetota bacterium]